MIRLIFAALMALAVQAQAQDAYPSRTITIVCPYAAGTTPDLIARHFAEALSKRVGQPVVVESKLGAGGLLGTEYAAAQKPDGCLMCRPPKSWAMTTSSSSAGSAFSPPPARRSRSSTS